MTPSEEKKLFRNISKGDEKSFEKLFHRYYGHLCHYATSIVNDKNASEEIVQNFFVKLWEKKGELAIETSVKNYLFRSVRNFCVNYLKHNQIKNQYVKNYLSQLDKNPHPDDIYTEPDLSDKIEKSISELPEKRREIFRLSREEGLKYKEIAEKLQISIKTVETQMGLAIKTLREKLRNFYTFFSLLL